MKCNKMIINGLCSALSICGVVGAVLTAVKATPKAIDIIAKREAEKEDKLTRTEIVKETWKVYIPTAAVAASSIALILLSTIMSAKAQKSMTVAYAAISSAYNAYKEANIEINGVDAHRKILDRLAVEPAKKVYITNTTAVGNTTYIMDENEEEVLFYDSFSERYFTSTNSRVLGAVLAFNRNYVLRGSAPINELYGFLGLDNIEGGDTVGFDIESEIYFIDFDFHKAEIEDGLGDHVDAVIIDMIFEPGPICNYW